MLCPAILILFSFKKKLILKIVRICIFYLVGINTIQSVTACLCAPQQRFLSIFSGESMKVFCCPKIFSNKNIISIYPRKKFTLIIKKNELL